MYIADIKKDTGLQNQITIDKCMCVKAPCDCDGQIVNELVKTTAIIETKKSQPPKKILSEDNILTASIAISALGIIALILKK